MKVSCRLTPASCATSADSRHFGAKLDGGSIVRDVPCSRVREHFVSIWGYAALTGGPTGDLGLEQVELGLDHPV